ncbi:hypothetical protein CORC01_08478 [Colletotrichum orchidophilum]|uniref:Uncharacterized protein n=1 Tax=Colletotrichum orchidophilum TaxID=1209926 RepID=A0A1G4B4A4_9PEZI|nr:uncharacterized protein CORC01_08478 [Colletotrichum orchidophilum]OHE96260.1 hypothetical protein CORC01_08478 [Colletotrichum orchidophilum]
MSSSTSVLSKTLQSITTTKIRELEKQRTQLESRKGKILEQAESYHNQCDRINSLLHGVKELYSNGNRTDTSIDNIGNLLAQSKYDTSVPSAMLRASEELLRSKLEVQSHKLNMAHLYSRLVSEWINPGSPMENPVAADLTDEDSSLSDCQQERLRNLCDQFEKVVFTPLETDETEINNYLSSLLETSKSKRAFEDVRRQIAYTSEQFLKGTNPFNTVTLKKCITSLLQQDLLSDEKQEILREFEGNEVVLREIADVLNTRFADFDNWEWDAGKEGVPFLPRQQANGKYRIWMDEDVLQAIFIHWIGVNSCVSLKSTLTNFVSLDGADQVWRWHAEPPATERQTQRRTYYLGEAPKELSDRSWRSSTRRGGKTANRTLRNRQFRPSTSDDTVAGFRKKNFIERFCLAALPSRVDTLTEALYTDDGGVTGDDDGDDDAASSDWVRAQKSNLNVKQLLLRTLATETMLHQALHGRAAVVQSDLKWFGASLSHTSIFATLRFFGFPENLISFYRKVLETPVNLGPSSESVVSSSEPRVRHRGTPMGRTPAKLIGELILFVMDFAVNQETGLQLYRLHDDLWVAGDPEHTAKAWSAMERFAKVMGLEFNMKKTGSVYLTSEGVPRDEAIDAGLPKGPVSIGHLVLDQKTGKWTIDQAHVAEHVKQLRKQLAECRSVLDWVRTWNSCISRFFGQAFGEPAYCFGKEHVESVLQTYQKMQRDIFGPWCTKNSGCSTSGEAGEDQLSVVRYIKSKIEQRFGVTDVSDAFIFFPDQLGGLGLRNPFIPFLKAQESLSGKGASAEEKVQSFFDSERQDHEDKKRTFEYTKTTRMRELEDGFQSRFDPDFLGPDDADTFFTYEEYTANRSTTSSLLKSLYEQVQESPFETSPRTDRHVDQVLEGLHIQPASLWSEVQWIVQMYHQEAKDRFDGLRLVDERFLPLGVIDMMREKAVRWGLVL